MIDYAPRRSGAVKTGERLKVVEERSTRVPIAHPKKATVFVLAHWRIRHSRHWLRGGLEEERSEVEEVVTPDVAYVAARGFDCGDREALLLEPGGKGSVWSDEVVFGAAGYPE